MGNTLSEREHFTVIADEINANDGRVTGMINKMGKYKDLPIHDAITIESVMRDLRVALAQNDIARINSIRNKMRLYDLYLPSNIHT